MDELITRTRPVDFYTIDESELETARATSNTLVFSVDEQGRQTLYRGQGDSSPLRIVAPKGKDLETTTDIELVDSPIADMINQNHPEFGGVIPAGTSIEKILSMMLSTDKLPSVTLPYASISLENAGTYEAGNNFVPRFNVDFRPAVYTYGPTSTVTPLEITVRDTLGNVSHSLSGEFPQIHVTDGTAYSIDCSIRYSADTVVPLTSHGNPTTLAVKEGVTAVSHTAQVKSFRRYFYAVRTETNPISELTGEFIRGNFVHSASPVSTAADSLVLEINETTKQVCIAVPATYSILKCKDEQAFDTDISSSFRKSTVSIPGYGGNDPISYNLYVFVPLTKLGESNYKITFTKN